jgi:general secretion pathway protein H
MSLRDSAARQHRAFASVGFTLLEMVLVLAILGMAMVLVVGYRPPWSRGYEVDTIASELAAQLRLVRSAAIAGNRSVAFEIDLPGHRYRAGLGSPRPLPARLGIELLTVTGERQGERAGGIRFHPDGSSTGGRIVLADGARRVAVGVDWLTGRVSVADVR